MVLLPPPPPFDRQGGYRSLQRPKKKMKRKNRFLMKSVMFGVLQEILVVRFYDTSSSSSCTPWSSSVRQRSQLKRVCLVLSGFWLMMKSNVEHAQWQLLLTFFQAGELQCRGGGASCSTSGFNKNQNRRCRRAQTFRTKRFSVFQNKECFSSRTNSNRFCLKRVFCVKQSRKQQQLLKHLRR